MDSSLGTGFMAVFAASGSVVLLAMQVHKRLLSNFMKQMEFEFKNSTVGAKDEPKKKVRFADEETVADQRSCGKKSMSRPAAAAAAAARSNNDQSLEGMPQNWQVMYKGILQCRNLRGYNN